MTGRDCAWCDDGRPHLHASDWGGCLRAVVAGVLGTIKPIPPSDKLQAIYDSGHEHEEVCIAEMRKSRLVWGTQQEIMVANGPLPIVGHLDGITNRDGLDRDGAGMGVPRFVLEVKSPGAYGQFERAVRTGVTTPLTRKYLWQTSTYMHSTGLECLVACLDENGVQTFGIELPPFTLDEVVARVATIASYVARNELPPSCGDDLDDWGCPYRHALHTEKPPAEQIDDELLEVQAIEYATWTATKAKAERELKRLRPVFDARFTEAGEWNVGKMRVLTYEQNNPPTYDEELAAADGVDLSKYRVTKKGLRLKITELKENDAGTE